MGDNHAARQAVANMLANDELKRMSFSMNAR